MFKVYSVIIGYFIGCLQTAYFVGKIKKIDLREHGSGNLGSTNALRVLGKTAALATFLGDVFKSILSFIICSFIFKQDPFLAGVYGCLGTIIGHDYPFYLKFKGGKGIASMIGAIFCIGFFPAVISLSIASIGLAFKYVSLFSVIFSICLPIMLLFFNYEW